MEKKGWIAILLAAALLSGCGADADREKRQDAGNGTEVQEISLDEKALTDALLGLPYDKEVSALDAAEISNYIELYDGVEAVMYMSEGSTAEEFGIFTAPDANVAAQQAAEIETFLADQKDSFRAYIPEEEVRIDQAVLITEGRYVVLSVSGEPQEAEQLIREAFQGE